MLCLDFSGRCEPIHRHMADERERTLHRLSSMYDDAFRMLGVGREKQEPVGTSETSLVELEALYHAADKMPVWPFDTQNLMRFLSATTIPVVLFIAENSFSEGKLLHRLLGN